MSFRNPFRRRNHSFTEDIASIAALDDPARAALFQHVTSAGGDVTRDEAAAAVGVTRRIAAFNLDRLVAEGLLEASFRRLSGKSGPGAGRPSKLYRRSGRRLDVSLPTQNYELLARLLASAVEGSEGPAAIASLEPGAHTFGTTLGAAARAQAGPGASRKRLVAALIDELAGQGFEPFVDGNRTLRLRNCPYHDMARENTDLVCSINLALMEGVADGLGLADLEPSLEPAEGTCCVAFHLRGAGRDRELAHPRT
jgi:predicted ArsR family transcriptional regulator